MRTLGFVCVLLAACAGRQTAWVPLEPIDVPDGGEAFVLVDRAALHLSNVEYADGHLQGDVVHAWAVPPVGVAALASDSRAMAPEQIAKRAGWPELRLAAKRVDVPAHAIRSTRAAIEPEPDPDPPQESSTLGGFVTELVEELLVPDCCCRGYYSARRRR